MIPAPFEYSRPANVAEALELLSQHGDSAALLAGGHSLIPMMKLRFARPERIVDIRKLSEWRGVSAEKSAVRIGALTTQAEIIASEELAAACPILRETALQIADPQVRALGTVGGNAANGDPGNDMPAVLLALDAEYELSSSGGKRSVKAREFYKGAFETARRPDEALSAIVIQTPPCGAAYVKQKRKVGDYATAAAAAVLEMKGGKCVRAAVALTNAAPAPLLLEKAAAALEGGAVGEAEISRAAAEAEAAADPASDERGPAAFRKKLAGVMTRRALALARERAV